MPLNAAEQAKQLADSVVLECLQTLAGNSGFPLHGGALAQLRLRLMLLFLREIHFPGQSEDFAETYAEEPT